jgi:hypothetical protein
MSAPAFPATTGRLMNSGSLTLLLRVVEQFIKRYQFKGLTISETSENGIEIVYQPICKIGHPPRRRKPLPAHKYVERRRVE